MLAPYLVGLAALVFVPAAITFWLAFHEYDLIGEPRFLGLDNFRELWTDDVFGIALRNSLLFVAIAVPLRLLAALALGLLLHARGRATGAARAAVLLPTVVPDAAYALLWIWILNPLYGPLNLLLGAAGAPTPRWLTDPTSARWAVIGMLLFQIGEGFLVVLAVRQSIPQQLYEAAALESASALQMLRRVTLPLMAPALVLLCLRDTIFSFQANFVPALLVTQGGPPPYATTYVPLFIYRNGFEYLRYGYASAATLVLFAVTALVLVAQWRILRRWRQPDAV
ncbi:MAG: sugar ABC transporter permease [Actinomycetota bacterium]|nr:sugar ABC transporter permease [Actinomycetota bacterium]